MVVNQTLIISENILHSWVVSKLIVAVAILLIGFIIGKFVEKSLSRLFKDMYVETMAKKAGLKFSIKLWASKIAALTIYVITIVIAIQKIGLGTKFVRIVLGLIIILVLIAVALIAKDFFPNMIARYYLKKNRLMNIGDVIKFDSVEGKIEKISLMDTRIKTNTGKIVIIPNRTLADKFAD